MISCKHQFTVYSLKMSPTKGQEGRKEGRKEGEALVNRSGVLLSEAGREKEFMNSLSDEKLQNELFMEFGLKNP